MDSREALRALGGSHGGILRGATVKWCAAMSNGGGVGDSREVLEVD